MIRNSLHMEVGNDGVAVISIDAHSFGNMARSSGWKLLSENLTDKFVVDIDNAF